MDITSLASKIDSSIMKTKSLTDWRSILAPEVGVYVFGENYLAKRFDAINYKFCDKTTAKEILIDNLYALLRFKYFPASSEAIDNRINEIVSSFTQNLKTTLIKVSFDKSSDCVIVNMLPDYCIAFRNGVFDFKHNKFLFKYDITKIEGLSNKIYTYDPKWVIQWYLDYDFEPLPIDINETTLVDFIDIFKEITKTDRNYCFELMYNIAHDYTYKFDINRFTHLCEILGYTLLNSFSQHFVMLIGSGQNGKNSLFDGCFSCRVNPTPAANDLSSIETDRFVTGSLENKGHNIYLETSTKAETYSESKTIKALTGSMYQTIESKGISKYSSIINCKFLFSANDQDKVKFSDNTTGFRRRINMFEIYYQWDEGKRFMKKGDYYDTTFSDSLSELKDDILNTTAYVYFGMYGILSGTNYFTRNFKFTQNDWSMRYTDIDVDIKDRIEAITPALIVRHFKSSTKNYEEGKNLLYDLLDIPLYKSKTIRALGFNDYDSLLRMLDDPETATTYFSENDIYISTKLIQTLAKDLGPSLAFTQNLKKIYGLTSTKTLSANKSFVKCTFNKGTLRVIK